MSPKYFIHCTGIKSLSLSSTGPSRCSTVLTSSTELLTSQQSLGVPLLWLVLLTPHLDGGVLQYIHSFTVEPYADEKRI